MKLNIFNIFVSSYLLFSQAATVNVQLLKTLFYETQRDLQSILISIDTVPIERFSIDIHTSDNSSYIFPNKIDVDRLSSTNHPIEIAFIAGNAGDNFISVSLSGMNALDYSVEYVNDINKITVLNSNTEPPKPFPISAFFSNDGSSVFVKFDSNTNQGEYDNTFPCSELLSFYGHSQSICNWINSTFIGILTNTVNVGSDITILGNKILPFCEFITCVSNFVDSHTLFISSPINPIIPAVSISTPSMIGGCNPIIFDLSSSVGSGGRPWKYIHFKLNSSSYIDNSLIEDFLNTHFIMSPPTPLPNSFLNRGDNYTFDIRMCNFLHICGLSSTTISVLSSTLIPSVNIIGSTTKTILSTDSLLINSNAYTTNCEGVSITSGLSYSWSIYLNGIDLHMSSESKDSSKFKLSPNRLLYGNNYIIHLSVTNSDGKESSISTSVTVLQSPLLVTISGSSTKTMNYGDSIILTSSPSTEKFIYSW